MRRLAWVSILGLLAVVPAVGQGPPPGFNPLGPVPPGPPPGFDAAQQPNAYTPPKADAPVVELLDEGITPLFQHLNNDNSGEAGNITREDRDVFSGVEAARVTPNQRFSSRIPGWNFRIVETPKNAGEFRYLRFAWKKVGGTGIMIQLHDATKTWNQRFFAGRNLFGWEPATSVSDKLPGEWELVTRDLFKENGASTITGIALTSLDGTAALFDHMLLGRTVNDLDKVTDSALGKVKPTEALRDKAREAMWAEMVGTDAKKAAAALRVFLATATDHVAFIRDRLTQVPDKDGAGQIRKLILDLDSDKFETRQTAMDELIRLGAPVIDAVRDAGTSTVSDEVRFRARIILKQLGGGTGEGNVSGKGARMSRAVRVLERAGTGEAKALLTDIAAGKVAPECSADAKAALARLPKLP